MVYSVGRTIERMATLAQQMDHIQKNMTSLRTGERLSYARATTLLRIAAEEVRNDANSILEQLV